MTRSAKIAGMRPADPPPPGELPTPGTDDESSRVVARPDGYYWVADDGQQQFGPFPTAEEAERAMREGIDTGLEPDQTLQEAESEVGYSEVPPTEEGTE